MVLIMLRALFHVFVLFAAAAPAFVAAEEENVFFRLKKNDAGEMAALETGIVTYTGRVNGKVVTVDLIAAVHVGEKEYYDQLNKQFSKYDALLYELVSSEGVVLKDLKTRPKSTLSSLQGMIRELLALEFQLDEIDYDKPNFVHADLTADAFVASMNARGDSLWTYLGRALIQSMNEQQAQTNPMEDWKLIMALLTSDDNLRAFKMRRYLAQNFAKVDDLVAKLEGPNGGVLIGDRNAKAVDVLTEQVKLPKKSRFGIFYGGAHMPDLERRMLTALPLKRSGNRWLVAWALQPKQK